MDSQESLTTVFLETLDVAARQVGAVARRLQGRVENLSKDGGGTPESDALSSVDLAAQDIVLEALHHRMPGIHVDAEEDTETVGLFSSATGHSEQVGAPLVVLDPIDGSLSYLSGSDDWAVMAGLLEGGHYLASYVYYPAFEVSIRAARGQGARMRRGRGPWREAVSSASSNTLLVGPRFPEAASRLAVELGLQPTLCRCSAVEGAVTLLGRGVAAATPHPVGRRHAIPLFASVESGATVLFGDTSWKGEDPVAAAFPGPTVVAHDVETGEKIRAALRQVLGSPSASVSKARSEPA